MEQTKQPKKDMFYGYNPSKNVILGFQKEETLKTFLQYDPKKYGDNIKPEYQRKQISFDEFKSLQTEKNTGFFPIDNGYQKRIDSVKNSIKDNDKIFLRIKRKGFNTIGIVAPLNKEQYEDLKKNQSEFLSNHTEILDKNMAKNNTLIVAAHLNGNVINHKENDATQFVMKIAAITKSENFKKLNPDYSKFACMTTNVDDKKKQPVIFHFKSAFGRDKFIKKMEEIIANSKGKETIQSISNFNGITTLKVKNNNFTRTSDISKNTEALTGLLDSYRDQVKNNLSKQSQNSIDQKRQKVPTQQKSRNKTI